METVVADEPVVIDHSGSLYLPDHRALVVADLHLEKGSWFAQFGQLLPPYDSATTLARLSAAIAFWRPLLVVALGDSFHDCDGPSRLNADNLKTLAALQAGRDFVWLTGNHDSDLSKPLPGRHLPELHLGRLELRHEPQVGVKTGELAGHLHPVALLSGRRKAFVTDGLRMILPAFGAYAGGLNLRHRAIADLFKNRIIAYVLGQEKIYPICASRCHGG